MMWVTPVVEDTVQTLSTMSVVPRVEDAVQTIGIFPMASRTKRLCLLHVLQFVMGNSCWNNMTMICRVMRRIFSFKVKGVGSSR